MPLIKHGVRADDPWRVLPDDAAAPRGGDILVSPARLEREYDALRAREGRLGARLTSAEGPDAIAPYLDGLACVALDFPAFTDGRAYSSARLLRVRHGYRGEVRAVGDVGVDQLFFMARCGFDAFVLDREDAASAFESAMGEMGAVYQPSADDRVPVWARRHAAPAMVAAE